jgi:hypothetical protein
MTKNRETWLHEAAENIAAAYHDVFVEHFGEKAVEQHLGNLRVSAGFPSRGGESGKVIGQCWNSKSSKDKSHHIFISPQLKDPVRVLATQAHEMVHAIDDGEHKHKGVFVKAVRALGLEGKPTATFAGPDFRKFVDSLVKDTIGEYPHEALVPTLKTEKQKTYMLKVTCPHCGCVVRMTQKWVDQSGAPFCGTRSHMIDGKRSDTRVRMEVE